MKKKRPSIDFENESFSLQSDYDKELVEAVKQLPQRRWNGKRWIIADTPANIEKLPELVSRFDIGIKAGAKDRIKTFKNSQITFAEISRLTEIDESLVQELPLFQKLRPFQIAGALYAAKKRACIIGDPPGLGKSVQALAAVELQQSYPCLIVCPATLKLNWRNEIAKWLPGRSVIVLATRTIPDTRKEYDFVIVNYDLLGKRETVHGRNAKGLPKVSFSFPYVERLLDVLGPFGSLILDESQYIKNPRALRTKACLALSKAIPVRYCLSGTPIMSRPVELVPQLQAIGKFSELFGSFWQFAHKHCGARKTPWGMDFSGATHLAELGSKLRSSCFIRREKADVLKELPAKQRLQVEFELPAPAFREYEKARKDVVRFLRTYSAAKAASAERAKYLVQLQVLQQLAAYGKRDAVIEWAGAMLDSGEKLVLFGIHTELLKSLHDEFKDSHGARLIIGATSMKEREAAVSAFQGSEDCRLLVGNIRAAGVGLTLTAASNVAFVEFPWTPAELEQGEDRIHRIGQSEVATAWHLVAKNTIDEMVLEVLTRKAVTIDKVLSAGDIEGSVLGAILDKLLAAD